MSETDTYIELYVRSLLPDGAGKRQDALIDELDELDRAGEIAGYDVIVWGKQIAPESAAATTDGGRYILNRIAEFKQWALSNNVSLESFYERRIVESAAANSATDAIRLPVIGLAEYDGDELVHVAPCTKDGTVHTITDRLKNLEAGLPSPLADDTTARSLV